MNTEQPTWLDQVNRLRAHLNAVRAHHTYLVESSSDDRFIAEAEADIKATLSRLSDLAAI